MSTLVPPDGGWGYAICFALSIMMSSVIVPISSFALVFGKHLSTFTDETYATAIVTSLFGTVLHITGLLSHFVFKRFTYRQVGTIGSLLYFLGSFSTAFAEDLNHIVFTYSILQGIGVGLIMPSGLSALNSYFEKKKAMMNGVAQAILTCINISFPMFTRYLVEMYGFRGTQAIFAAISLHALLGSVLLQPVKYHMKKSDENFQQTHQTKNQDSEDDEMTMYKTEEKDATLNVYNKKNKNKNNCCDILDMDLIKDGSYVNMAFGLAICTSSEMNFTAILPLFLFDLGLNKREVTILMTVYFASDLLMRLAFVLFAALFTFSCRYVFFWNALVCFVLRLVFLSNTSFWWITFATSMLGFSRCLIQSPMPVVIAESYSKKFPSALSFYMVVTGLTSIALGAVMGLVRTNNKSSSSGVFHVLNVSFLFCIIPWALEMIYRNLRKGGAGTRKK